MKNMFFFFLCSCSMLYGCKEQTQQVASENLAPAFFNLSGTLENFNADIVFLNKIENNAIIKVDSANIINQAFNLKGSVKYPERLALSFPNQNNVVVVIIENKDFQISLNKDKLNDPVIIGSPLNTMLNQYKIASKNIFKKIEYLYPEFQRARLENNALKLEEVGAKMKSIEDEFTEFSFKYIQKNRHSFIAPMILSDQLKTSPVDTLRIKNHFELFSKEIKESPDSKRIKRTLNLH